MRPNLPLAVLALGLVTASSVLPALARSGREEISPAEEQTFPYDADIPGCQDADVLEKVSTQFAEKEAKFWNSSRAARAGAEATAGMERAGTGRSSYLASGDLKGHPDPGAVAVATAFEALAAESK